MKYALCLALLLSGTLVGCQAERRVVPPAEPMESYHDPDWSDSPSQAFWTDWEQRNTLLAGSLVMSVEER